jgi:hypothetical protein
MIRHLGIFNINVRDLNDVCKALEMTQEETSYVTSKLNSYDSVIHLVWIDHDYYKHYRIQRSINKYKDVKKVFRIKNLEKTLKQISTVKEDYPELFI